MSLVSDPAIFSVAEQSKRSIKTGSTITNGLVSTALPAPITELTATSATSEHIVLSWSSETDAKDYKLYWDKGDTQQTSLFYPLASSTSNSNTFTVDNATTGTKLFGPSLAKTGGSFSFKVTYISSKTG